jgi:hypothetical protein
VLQSVCYPENPLAVKPQFTRNEKIPPAGGIFFFQNAISIKGNYNVQIRTAAVDKRGKSG